MIFGALKRAAARYRKGQRDLDLRILWPACKLKSQDLNHARAAFAYHAMNDRAWTAEMDDSEIIDYVSALV